MVRMSFIICRQAFFIGTLLSVEPSKSFSILSGPFANTTYEALRFSQLIGNFTDSDCETVVGELVTVPDNHNLCTIGSDDIGDYYRDKVIYVESFLVPERKNLNGCAYEERYNQAIQAGAIGLVTYRNRAPGNCMRCHTMGYELNKGSVPLINLGGDFSIVGKLLNDLDASLDGMIVQLSCASENKNALIYLWVMPITNAIIGGVSVYAGISAQFEVRQLYKRPTYPRDQGLRTRAHLLSAEGAILILIGLVQCLGFSGDSNSSPIGDAVIGYQIKSFFSTQFSGISFFTSFVLALFWLELRQALKSGKLVQYAPSRHKLKCVLIFILFALPEPILQGMNSFAFAGPGLLWITPLIFISNVGVAIFFVVQVKATIKQINSASVVQSVTDTLAELQAPPGRKSRLAAVNPASGPGNASVRRTRKLMRHMAWWMACFSLFVLMQCLALLLFPSIFGSAFGVYVFVVLTSGSRVGMSIAKVWSLKPPREQNVKVSAVAQVKKNLVTTSVQDRSQWD